MRIKEAINYQTISRGPKSCLSCVYYSGTYCKLYNFLTTSFGHCNNYELDTKRFPNLITNKTNESTTKKQTKKDQ